jgi:hypothetical protein
VAELKEGKKVPLTIRIPDELRRRLARVAKQHGTSLNAEILQRLQASIDTEGHTGVLRQILDELRGLLSEARKK